MPGVAEAPGVAVAEVGVAEEAGADARSATFFSRATTLDSSCCTWAEGSVAPWHPTLMNEHDMIPIRNDFFINALLAPISLGPSTFEEAPKVRKVALG